MRFTRTLLWLALLTAVCELGIYSVFVPQVVAHELPRQIGNEIGRWFVIFAPSALGAGIVAFATRKRPPRRYPGLATGILVAWLFTLIAVIQFLS